MLRNLRQLTFSHCRRQTLSSRSAPFEYIEPKFGVVVSLVTIIAKIDNWSSNRSRPPITIVEGQDIPRGRRGRCVRRGRCGDDASKQHANSAPKASKFHGQMQVSTRDLMG